MIPAKFTLPEIAAARAFAAASAAAQETPQHGTIRRLAEAAIRLTHTFARDLPAATLVDLLITQGMRAADLEVDLTPGPAPGPAAARRARLAEIDALILAPQNTLTLAQARALMAERAAIRAALAG